MAGSNQTLSRPANRAISRVPTRSSPCVRKVSPSCQRCGAFQSIVSSIVFMMRQSVVLYFANDMHKYCTEKKKSQGGVVHQFTCHNGYHAYAAVQHACRSTRPVSRQACRSPSHLLGYPIAEHRRGWPRTGLFSRFHSIKELVVAEPGIRKDGKFDTDGCHCPFPYLKH